MRKYLYALALALLATGVWRGDEQLVWQNIGTLACC